MTSRSVKPVSIVLAGIGGYGEAYLSALLDEHDRASFRIVAAADPEPERCTRLADLEALDIPVVPSLEHFYNVLQADLAVIAAPIHLHEPLTGLSLSHGSHVLCEKPAAATVQDVDAMIAARNRAGRFAAVGYQWSFLNCIQTLKADIRSGFLGKPRRFKSLCLWPRDESYYGRNDWAGSLRDAEGRWVLDSPANNAMAHFLHNMLYCLEEEAGASANPVSVTAEGYRANPIENYDTAAIRAETGEGVEVFMIVSHAVPEDVGPVFSFEFEGGKVEYAGGLSPITARLNDGTAKEYGSPEREEHFMKLWTCIAAAGEAAAGQGAGTGGGNPESDADAGLAIPCGLEAARAQTLCVNGAQESIGSPQDFPESIVRERGKAGQRLRWVEGLDQVLRDCFVRWLLPSEAGVPWARPGEIVDLTGYNRFPREDSE